MLLARASKLVLLPLVLVPVRGTYRCAATSCEERIRHVPDVQDRRESVGCSTPDDLSSRIPYQPQVRACSDTHPHTNRVPHAGSQLASQS